MALLQNRDACKSWTSLLVTVSQMVDWVHFTTTHDTFHQVVSPKIWEAVNKLSGIYADEESTVDLATELKQLLMEHSWNGRSFAQDVSAVNLLSALKSFKLKCERPLGKGAYAKVFLARSQLTDEVVVHKHVQIDSPEHGLPLHVLRELAILQKMRHPHIVRCGPPTQVDELSVDPVRSFDAHGYLLHEIIYKPQPRTRPHGMNANRKPTHEDDCDLPFVAAA